MRLLGERVIHWGRYIPKQGNPLQSFKNHSQLPNIFILLSFFWFTFSSFQGSLSWSLIILRFFSKRWGFLWKFSAIEADTAWNRGIHCKILKTTHNYLIFILLSLFISISHNFKVHRVDIWSHWGFSGVRGEVISEKVLPTEATTAWNRGVPCKI